MTEIDDRKNAIRHRVWSLLDDNDAVIGGSAQGRIPNFVGAEAASDRLATLAVWREASVVKAVPDKAQLPARARALREGKLVYMAVPKLAKPNPFYLLDPAALTVPAEQAASSRTAPEVARTVGLDDLRPVDLVVCGSVAVTPGGVRLGKGAGYSDIEIALLARTGLIGEHTTIATTVHPLQIVDETIPETSHDFSVDLIITPDRTLECSPPRRPTDLTWDDLTPEQLEAMPVLKSLQRAS
ncbi:5-formyltetrahydrofolate cyclo-ligase [Saccharopolyspora lacisalsi]|uniref:5-formyltetrahydrofolate cyclo-ligase n=1 Tax=Halosaccharopolyspora lacisalsi TaxID=1000566 RepID=A0A839DWG9_9PSEU|nr:5-formyltetrahydrofolate cyclo-ligase [Halosaccharopolyspora lacisalsi]MBA8823797.1 5-formyltetrahydrofolate cyclo-ligase [Halosaccharopolyspora lacisalsi]